MLWAKPDPKSESSIPPACACSRLILPRCLIDPAGRSCRYPDVMDGAVTLELEWNGPKLKHLSSAFRFATSKAAWDPRTSPGSSRRPMWRLQHHLSAADHCHWRPYPQCAAAMSDSMSAGMASSGAQGELWEIWKFMTAGDTDGVHPAHTFSPSKDYRWGTQRHPGRCCESRATGRPAHRCAQRGAPVERML